MFLIQPKQYTVSRVDSSRRARMFYAADGSILGSTLSLFTATSSAAAHSRVNLTLARRGEHVVSGFEGAAEAG